jgi:hypothetical protein
MYALSPRTLTERQSQQLMLILMLMLMLVLVLVLVLVLGQRRTDGDNADLPTYLPACKPTCLALPAHPRRKVPGLFSLAVARSRSTSYTRIVDIYQPASLPASLAAKPSPAPPSRALQPLVRSPAELGHLCT